MFSYDGSNWLSYCLLFSYLVGTKEVVVASTKTVKFNENIREPKQSSNPVYRSKSFAQPRKGHVKESKDTRDPGISRSLSFGGKMKNKQPARPSPPTFFVNETETETNLELDSKKPINDDAIKEEDTSTSQEGKKQNVPKN
jgi:hypothetical protein